jgi:acetyl-CoA carboxylase biotin carboxylase subunit
VSETRRFGRILVANRGEIAVRVVRACREMGIATVAVYSEADRAARHVRVADEAVAIGEAPSRDSYLRIDRIIDAARRTRADAVHPGYGFLAENEEFARACASAGVAFIGPRPETIALMGEKTSARREAVAAGVPVVPGALEPQDDPEALARDAERLGYPVMLKAAAGGGGKGLRLVSGPDELASALERARSEARGAFGDERVYLEKAIARPRHVEIQVLADQHGRVVHLFERECSVQRRHQKLVEESPSPLLTPQLRAEMGALAVALARRTGYVGAGTLEFLVGEDRKPYFLEMNTRLQVEHPVTEVVTGVDLVQAQIRIAQGEPLGFVQDELVQRGHAIECRVYAEDPENGFLPSPGRILALRTPSGPGIRDDSGFDEGSLVPTAYDPLLSKLVAWGGTRPEAIARLRRALAEYTVLGVRTTLPFFERLLRHPEFERGAYDTGLVARVLAEAAPQRADSAEIAAVAAAVHAFRERRRTRQQAEVRSPLSAWRAAGLREQHAARLGG